MSDRSYVTISTDAPAATVAAWLADEETADRAGFPELYETPDGSTQITWEEISGGAEADEVETVTAWLAAGGHPFYGSDFGCPGAWSPCEFGWEHGRGPWTRYTDEAGGPVLTAHEWHEITRGADTFSDEDRERIVAALVAHFA